jgi:hypothetical protein
LFGGKSLKLISEDEQLVCTCMLLVLNGVAVLLMLDRFTVTDAQMQFSLGAIWFPDKLHG